ncbi:MAG: BamA/TamA family outer membrane protein, partial [Bacteroidota bacterium]
MNRLLRDRGRLLRATLLLFCCCLCCSALKAQSEDEKDEKKKFFLIRYLNNIVNDSVNHGQPKLLFYPTVAFAPETSWEFGFSTLYLYYAKRDTSNRLSEIYGWTFLTLERQYGIWFDHALYTDKNNWFLLGRARYQRFPLLYYGIGPDAPPDPTAVVDADFLLVKERVLRRIRGSWFTGLEIDYQALTRSQFIPESDSLTFDLPIGHEGSQNLGIGWGLLYDDRHNVLNVRHGHFLEMAFLHSNTAWGSDYNFTNVILDARIYRKTTKNQVFAAHALGLFSTGDVPFNQLSQMGGESMMRGYYFGRFRDKNHLALQAEYRFLPFVDKKPFRRFGGAVFLGTGTVF